MDMDMDMDMDVDTDVAVIAGYWTEHQAETHK